MNQAIEFFCPALKGFILSTNIRCHVSLVERDGVIPSKTFQVLHGYQDWQQKDIQHVLILYPPNAVDCQHDAMYVS